MRKTAILLISLFLGSLVCAQEFVTYKEAKALLYSISKELAE